MTTTTHTAQAKVLPMSTRKVTPNKTPGLGVQLLTAGSAACVADFPTLPPPMRRDSPIKPPQTSHKSFGSNLRQPSTPLTPPNSNKNQTNFPLAFDEHHDDDNDHTSTDDTTQINDVHPTIPLPVSQEVQNRNRSKQRQNRKWNRFAKMGAKPFA